MMAFSLSRIPFALMILCVALCAAMAGSAVSRQMPPDGRALYNADCATCHGADGRGGRTPAEVGFDLKLPDFADCSFATREADSDWSATIHRGGRARAFPRIMPAFGDALSDDEIDAIITYLRGFCTDESWPRGEFNFPLALFTEKAFPEDEFVWTTAIDTKGAANINSEMTLEKRIGTRSQLELTLPFSVLPGTLGMGTQAGIGDFGVAWKQNLYANVESGTIFSLLGEAVLPTGNSRKGLGTGSMSFEPHALFGQMLPGDFIFQGQVFAELPFHNDLVQTVNWTAALGRTFAEDDGYGRAWTPMVEILGSRDLASGAKTEWDIVPQFQVSLSTRQHILFDAGARIPLTDPSARNTQFVFYLIWDWYDAGLFEAW
jgi:mono/diheme cytochrome c family protein